MTLACENIRFSSLFRRWERFTRSSSRNVPGGEERGETDVFAGYSAVTLTVGARAKEGKRGGAPSPLPLTRPISSSIREFLTWRFREQIARSKKTPAPQANLDL